MKLFWCPQTRAARVLWMLEEAQLEHELVLVDIRDPGSISNPEFHAASPMGKVPALIDGEVKLFACILLTVIHRPASLLQLMIH